MGISLLCEYTKFWIWYKSAVISLKTVQKVSEHSLANKWILKGKIRKKGVKTTDKNNDQVNGKLEIINFNKNNLLNFI